MAQSPINTLLLTPDLPRNLRIGRYFTYEELTVTSHPYRNAPNFAQLMNLTRLCAQLLDPLREKFGPLLVTSGFRSPQVNAAIPGAKNSAHLEGRAADLREAGVRDVGSRGATSVDADSLPLPLAMIRWLAEESRGPVVRDLLPFDKAILERRGDASGPNRGLILHVQIAREIGAPEPGRSWQREPRRELLWSPNVDTWIPWSDDTDAAALPGGSGAGSRVSSR